MAKGPPRLDPYTRLISRFYESLYVLCISGRVQGPHIKTSHDPSSLIATRRDSTHLSPVCDYVKGGDRPTAISDEGRHDCNKFWISSNEGSKDNVTAFLSSVLNDRKMFGTLHGSERGAAEDNLACSCMIFAARRIRKEGKSLSAKTCRTYLETRSTGEGTNRQNSGKIQLAF